MYDLAKGLNERGHCVTVLTTFPQYNLTDSSRKSIENYPVVANEDGIHVIRLKTLPIHNVNHIFRGIGQLLLPLLFLWGTRLVGPQDVSVVYSPPITLGLAAYLIRKKEGTPFIFNVQDLFPQNAIDLGALQQPILIKFFRWMEDFIYRKADHISVHSGGNRNYVLSKGIGPTKISVIHNWVDLDEFKIEGVPNPIREKNDLSDKFIVFFGGVMGYAQDLETVVDCAHLLKDHKQIIFLLLGDGAEKKSLVKRSQSLGLTNIKFLPFVSKEEYPSWVNASDVGLVTLKSSMKTPVVPSKILSYMAAGKPILASLNPESDGVQIVEKANCGINVPAGNPAAMADAILKLLVDGGQTKAMGEQGRSYAEKHFSIDACIDEYEEIFRRIAK